MCSVKFCYLEACDNLRVKKSEKILLKIEEAKDSSTLNLSAVELTDDVCKTVGHALSNDVFLVELDLSNCMLNDNGLSSILFGLQKNKYLRTLILNGNNIRSIGTQAIGKLLRHNNHLENLYLEWNGTGIFPEKFSYLCEGLSINASLKSLDLRNNQLNHLCAQSLSDALHRNSTLVHLDLRWNTVGLLGGRVLLKALTRNKTLLKLDVSGNDIPTELQKSIELMTSASTERYLINNENVENAKVFASKVNELEKEQNQQLKLLLEQLDKKEKDMSWSQRCSSAKLSKLEEALLQKEDAIENLTKRLQETQKKLSLVSEEKNSVSLSLNETETKLKELKRDYQLLLDKERKDKEDLERKLLEEIGSLKEENMFIKQQIQDYKMMQTNLEDQITKLKSSITKLEKMLEDGEIHYQEQISTLKNKHEEIIQKSEQVQKNEIIRIREEFSETENNIRQRIKLLENKNADLEKLVNEKEARILETKTQAEEIVEELKMKMKSDEEKLRKQMEERIQVLESSNKKQEELLKEQCQVMFDIKTKCTENDLLLAEEAHRTQNLQQCLEAKDVEKEAAIAKVKLEVKEQLEELSRVKILLQESCAENATLKEKIEEIQKQHDEGMKNKAEVIETLIKEADKQKSKMKELLKTESKRINDLHIALASYADSAKVAIEAGISDSEDK